MPECNATVSLSGACGKPAVAEDSTGVYYCETDYKFGLKTLELYPDALANLEKRGIHNFEIHRL